MRVIICKDYNEMSKKAAKVIASQLTLKPDSILGLATGSTPEGMYKELIKLYNEKEIDFSQVKSFNLDEYYGLDGKNNQSYRYFMNDRLFNHINIKKDNTRVPNGITKDPEKDCKEYDRDIKRAGGIDIQVLGIGGNAHIGFNEPSEDFEAGTHLVDLTQDTIEANSRFFATKEEVPTKAVTMGIGNILKAKKILLLASGEGKADAVAKMVHGKVNPEIPASILQFHNDVIVIVDEAAGSKVDLSKLDA